MLQDLLENRELRMTLSKLTDDSIDDIITKMAPFAFENKYNKSIMSDDIQDQLLIIKKSNHSFIIQKKSINEINLDLTYYEDRYKKMVKDYTKIQQFKLNLKQLEHTFKKEDFELNISQDFIKAMEIISKDLPESKFKKFLSEQQQNQVYKYHFCLYKQFLHINCGDIFGNILPIQEDKILIIPNEIQTINFKLKHIQEFFKDKIQKILQKQQTFQTLFSIQDNDKLKHFIKNVEEREIQPNTLIYKEGQIANQIFVVGLGEVLIKKRIVLQNKKFKNQFKDISVVTQNCIFGNQDEFLSLRTEIAETYLIFKKNYIFNYLFN